MKPLKSVLHQKVLWAQLLVVFFAVNPAFCEEPEFRVSIRGVIANIADAGMQINEASHLRLYPCDTTGKLQVQMDNAGKLEQSPDQGAQKYYLDAFQRLIPRSGLPSAGLSVFGDFNILRVRGLEPGQCCKICVMMLDPPYSGMVPLTDGDGKVVEFNIPAADAENPGKVPLVDLTKTPLMIPAPGAH